MSKRLTIPSLPSIKRQDCCEVPDQRLIEITKLVKPKRQCQRRLNLLTSQDCKGASRGEGLGNKFLSHIRQVDAICHVVRCFADGNITHVSGKVDPLSDIETINLELILADLETIDKRIGRVAKLAKSKDKDAVAELEVLEKLKSCARDNQLANSVDFYDEQLPYVRNLFLLTRKKMLYVANIGEDEVVDPSDNPYLAQVRELAASQGADVVPICARLEEEIAELDDEEKAVFLEDFGLQESGLDRLIQHVYSL